jgi:hypothetical protein
MEMTGKVLWFYLVEMGGIYFIGIALAALLIERFKNRKRVV